MVVTSTFPRWRGDREPPFVYELSRRLAEDFDVWVMAPHTAGARLCEKWGRLRVIRFRYCFEWFEVLAYNGGILANLRRNPLRYLLVPLFVLAQLSALVCLLKRTKANVVHAHWLIPQGAVALLARRLSMCNQAVLCTSHGSDLYGLRGPLFRLVKRWVMKGADRLTVVSRAMKDHAVEVGGNGAKIAVLSMGVDGVGRFVPDHSLLRHKDSLLYVGRLAAEKGLDLLIDALPGIVRERPDVVLTVAGTGPMEGALRSQGRRLGVESRIRFRGVVENAKLPELYRQATMLVLPSFREGFGLVCAEALACECPVVASDLPALRDIVRDGESGFLFSPGSSDELADRILRLLADPGLQRRFGEAGREWVMRHYDWRSVAGAYSALLHGMLTTSSEEKNAVQVAE